MWTTEYILSQVCVIVGMTLLASTFFIKNKKIILILGCLAAIFYGMQYLLLGAYTGVIINIVTLIRGIWFYINDKNNKSKDYISLIVCISLNAIFGIITFRSWVDILAILAGSLYAFAIWQSRIPIYRWLAMSCDICWLIYSIVINSVFAIITNSILIAVELIGIIKLYIKKNEISNNKESEKIEE